MSRFKIHVGEYIQPKKVRWFTNLSFELGTDDDIVGPGWEERAREALWRELRTIGVSESEIGRLEFSFERLA